MITVSGLTKHYGKRLAVDDLTFEVTAGRVTGFVGPNGAGKSTTMRMMVGLTRPDRGEVRYRGASYTESVASGPDRRRRPRRPVHASGPHRPEPPAGDRRPQRHRGRPGRAGAGRGRARHGCRPAGRRVLTRHAAAAGTRRCAAGRPPGAAARRAVERPGPGRHPLVADLPAGLRRPRWDGLRVEPPDRRAQHVRRRPGRGRRRPAARRRVRRRDHRPQRDHGDRADPAAPPSSSRC